MNADQMKAKIEIKCLELCKFLLEKNKSYGNSAADPETIFSDLPPLEGVKLRIDDKLKRIKNTKRIDHAFKDKDNVRDLIGYLILYEILMDENKATMNI